MYELLGILIIFLLGVLWHFLYDIFNQNAIIGFIAPVNESPWEHWKIAFFPWLLFAFFEYPFIKDRINNFIFAKVAGLLIFQLITFGVLYIHSSLTGTFNLALDIIMYFVGLAIGQMVSYVIMTKIEENKLLDNIALVLLIVELFLILVYTINPPRLDYFKDAVTGTYGIYRYQ